MQRCACLQDLVCQLAGKALKRFHPWFGKALARPPEYIIKYFGTELGAQTRYDAKTGMSIVNGAHDASKLSELLEGFIKKYVQCYACGNPETVVK